MKQFIYIVNGQQFIDAEAFGIAWKQAKETAAKVHSPIFRDVVQGENARHEVFYNSGLFNSVAFMQEDNVKIW